MGGVPSPEGCSDPPAAPVISAIGALSNGIFRSVTDSVRPAAPFSSIRATRPFSPPPGACAGTVDTTVPLARPLRAVHGTLKSSDNGT